MFSVEKSIEVLERTPVVLEHYLNGLSNDWLFANEGDDTWSPYDVLGHLIYGEQTDWMIRLNIILSEGEKRFEPFDRFAQLELPKRPIADLLNEFKSLRAANILKLKALQLSVEDLKLTGIHPEFGKVTLEQLISAWVVHDLGHIAQISRVMAKHYKEDVGPWKAYLGILHQ